MTDRVSVPLGRPTVSVVIPVKDDEAALARCLASLAAQTQRPDEVIVVDNGSSDGSARIARSSGATVIPCAQPGIPAASAAGYDAAKGEIILRLDSDCIPLSTWVRTMTDAFIRRPDVVAFTGRARFIDGPRVLRRALAAVYLGGYALIMAPTLGHPPLFGSNLGFRADAWRGIRSRVHRDDPELHDDIDLSFHLGERGRVRYLPEAEMGISMRPFDDAGSFARRVWRGFRTVLVHWPWDFPPSRWLRLLLPRPRPAAPPATGDQVAA